LPTAFAQFVKWMRYTDECALILESLNRLARRKMRRNLLGHKSRKDFSTRCHNLLAHNDQFRVQGLSQLRACNGVMVGDDEAINPSAARGVYQILRAREGIFGSVGMAVKFNGKSHSKNVIIIT